MPLQSSIGTLSINTSPTLPSLSLSLSPFSSLPILFLSIPSLAVPSLSLSESQSLSHMDYYCIIIIVILLFYYKCLDCLVLDNGK